MENLDKAEQRLSLISRRLQILNGEDLIKTSLTEGKNLKCFWATAPTGKPHIGYFIPLVKFADFLEAGVEVTVLLLDTYAFLINYKYPWDQVLERTKYYHSIVSAVIAAIGIPISQVRFVRNSDYEPTKEFMIDNYRLCALLTQQDTRDTGTEVAGSPMFSPMLTPGLQSLAEEYLGADMQFGGTDQLGIFQMAERFLPQLGYRKRAHLMNPMLGSLVGGKMSSSDPAHTKIMFLDGPEAVRRKISGAHCQDGDVTTNGILPILKEILIPISEFRSKRLWRQDQDRIVESSSSFPQTQQHRDHKNNENDIYQPFCSPDAPLGTVFTIEADVENGWDNKKHYKTYAEIEQDFADKRLRPAILKAAVAHTLNRLLAPIREAYARDETWRAVNKLAYPLDPDEVCC